jgi:hypothetical protein
VPIDGHVSGKGKRKHREFVAASGELSSPAFTTVLATASRLAVDYSRPGSVHVWCMDWRHVHPLLAAAGAVYADCSTSASG